MVDAIGSTDANKSLTNRDLTDHVEKYGYFFTGDVAFTLIRDDPDFRGKTSLWVANYYSMGDVIEWTSSIRADMVGDWTGTPLEDFPLINGALSPNVIDRYTEYLQRVFDGTDLGS